MIPDKSVVWRKEKATKSRVVREFTRHNRDSTRLEMVDKRVRRDRQRNYRVKFSGDSSSIHSPDLDNLSYHLKSLDTTKIVILLHEMMKKQLFNFSNHTRLTESQILHLKSNGQFQRAFSYLYPDGL